MSKDELRRVRLQKGSYTATIPNSMVRELKVAEKRYIRFVLSGDMLVIMPFKASKSQDKAGSKTDEAEQGDGSDRLQDSIPEGSEGATPEEEYGTVDEQLDTALGRTPEQRRRIEKFRMR